MSHNQLAMIDKDFMFPKNLTHVFISNNRIHHFPVTAFGNLSTIKLIDLQNNSIEMFEAEFFQKMKTGLELHIAGTLV